MTLKELIIGLRESSKSKDEHIRVNAKLNLGAIHGALDAIIEELDQRIKRFDSYDQEARYHGKITLDEIKKWIQEQRA